MAPVSTEGSGVDRGGIHGSGHGRDSEGIGRAASVLSESGLQCVEDDQSNQFTSPVSKFHAVLVHQRLCRLVLFRFQNFRWQSVSVGFFCKNLGFGFAFGFLMKAAL